MPQVTITLNTKFYEYSQNNSGGSIKLDDSAGIGHYVIIEATDSNDADTRARKIGLYFDGVENGRDCSCCGDRWSSAWSDEGTEEPTIYGNPVGQQEYISKDTHCYIHRINGTVEKIILQPKGRI